MSCNLLFTSLFLGCFTADLPQAHFVTAAGIQSIDKKSIYGSNQTYTLTCWASGDPDRRLLANPGIHIYEPDEAVEPRRSAVLSHLRVTRERFHVGDFLGSGLPRQESHVTVYLGSIPLNERLQMPDQTEWCLHKIDPPEGTTQFHVKATATAEQYDQNRKLIVPIDSHVYLTSSTHHSFPRKTEIQMQFFCALPDRPEEKVPELNLPDGLSLMVYFRCKTPFLDFTSKEGKYVPIKEGDQLEIMPGLIHKIDRVVMPDAEKKIRGHIEILRIDPERR